MAYWPTGAAFPDYAFQIVQPPGGVESVADLHSVC